MRDLRQHEVGKGGSALMAARKKSAAKKAAKQRSQRSEQPLTDAGECIPSSPASTFRPARAR